MKTPFLIEERQCMRTISKTIKQDRSGNHSTHSTEHTMSPLSLQGCRSLLDTQARNLCSPTNRTIDDEVVTDGFQFFFPISIALASLNVSEATDTLVQR
jgi:hypothetical protein